REIFPQIFHDAHDLGNSRSNGQMAAPVASLLASRGRRRIDLHRLLEGLLGDASPAVGNVDQRQERPAAAEGLAGAHPSGVAGARFQIDKRGARRAVLILHWQTSRATRSRRTYF